MVRQTVPWENRCEEDRKKSPIHRENIIEGETNKKEDGEAKHTLRKMVMSTMEKRGARGETGNVGAGAGEWGLGQERASQEVHCWLGRKHTRVILLPSSLSPGPFTRHEVSSSKAPACHSFNRREEGRKIQCTEGAIVPSLLPTWASLIPTPPVARLSSLP